MGKNCKAIWMVFLVMACAQTCVAQAAEAVGDYEKLTIETLADYAKSLKRDGDRNTYRTFIEHVKGRFLAARGKQTDWSQWTKLAAEVGRDLPSDLQKSMATEFRTNLAGDDQDLRAMSPKRVIDLLEALQTLSQRELAGEVSTRWILSSDAYKQCDGHQLYRLSYHIRKGGEPTGPARSRLVALVDSQYMSTPAKVKDFGALNAHLITIHILFGVDKGTRGRWASAIEGAFLADNDQIRSLSPNELRWAASALARLGRKNTADFARTWLSNPKSDLSDADGRDLLWLARQVSGHSEDWSDAWEVFAGHIGDLQKKDAAILSQLGPESWAGIITSMASGLSPARREAWSQRIATSYLSDPKRLVQLEAGQLAAIRTALSRLGYRHFGSESIVAANNDSLTWAPGKVLALRGPGEDKEFRTALIGYLSSDHGRTAAEWQAWSAVELRWMSEQLARDEDDWNSLRTQLIAVLSRRLFGKDEPAFVQMRMLDGTDAVNLLTAARNLGQHDWPMQVLKRGNAWKQWESLGSLGSLAALAGTDRKTSAAANRLALSQALAANLIDASDADLARDVEQFLRRVNAARFHDLSSRAIRQIRQTAGEDFRRIGLAHLVQVNQALVRLGESSFAGQYVNRSNEWKNWPLADQIKLCGQIDSRNDSRALADVQRKVLGDLVSQEKAWEPESLAKWWKPAAGAMGRSLPEADKARLARQLAERFGESKKLASLSVAQLSDLTYALNRLGQSNPNRFVSKWILQNR